ncbi:sodium-dependent transporter [Flammeovirgaceae bacterium SG7u.111]|nr:sodium-dependent transporter [Flammeovirgaceae bacterium SG7u.132]WPO37491.1 sodium-dependent transporter [Flammeovirgaceae bacterium SG7u.111]
MSINEQFSSRWGIILASLGMAVGAGNLWRFPRLAGQYGGTFIILWTVFLLVWSIPILMAEFAIGKQFKKAVVGSFAGMTGKKYTWMGVFITLCTLGITFYYSVVTGWALYYLGSSVGNAWAELSGGTTLAQELASNPDYLKLQWEGIANENVMIVALHIVSVGLGTLLLYRGVQNGLEKANKILIPMLFVMLIIISIIALNMENGINGLNYMFHVDVALFSNPTVWLEALSQSAWSTGAGWGLLMTISSYSRDKEDVTLNTFIGAFGNNTASIIAAMAILPSVFALAGTDAEALTLLRSGNQALSFMVIPELFAKIPGGAFLGIIFFVAFSLAAFSSLLPMLELLIKTLGDWGIDRHKAVLAGGVACIALGFPSAWSFEFFNNQDWVWGIGLIISGFFIAFSALKYGAFDFKAKFIDVDSDFSVSKYYFKICLMVNVFLAVVLVYWWMSQGYSEYPWFDKAGNWNVIDTYSNATIVTQWGIVLLFGLVFNKWIYKKMG